jgi:hypothetical protein
MLTVTILTVAVAAVVLGCGSESELSTVRTETLDDSSSKRS